MTNSVANQAVIIAKDVTKVYHDGREELQILSGVNISVALGEMLAIVGASGSGKSTLLHILGLLDKPSSGEVLIDGKSSHNLSEHERSLIRNRKLGFVYQFHHLLPEFSALDNVAMPLIVRRMPRSEAREQAAVVLEKVGLAERILHNPGQLSGGERQRVALARALVTQPLCLLADEPTGNLDSRTAANMFDLLVQIRQDFNTAFIIVTHDQKLADLADRQLLMERGVLSAAR
ncbi:ABC transporter ATP-binding protein [Oligella urethralis]|uniref:Lipoprotein ABC transporter ATP-binding protein n=1 Tax=Oligella urethralis DNF00040 TaxID=1401065 RepID=A0A095ZB43_9BURK|nr:ABC transporter ATP-binding protein [Oligella urethralis]KGF31843.1 lipoprotein ABC transporter ATP-binding protein [Oligella urethralis DNF00040]SUA55734.1 Lipoprotein-releasing system ATP-binding protein LolD [Oligella urethralis]SUA58808.1 Lipoprotein-releasing system ATP-binding protein LolD [Oligella urethralis]